ncbi:MAG: AzlC family ABC transporter permease [Acetobacteraceae bacterium]|nr:AzlC family ABC transporter permease [Acetobacteraceae bacterium]
MHVVFTRAGMARGAARGLPLVPIMIPFGLVVGMVAAAKGLSFAELVLMSMLVFAGASQLLALELWDAASPALGAAVAAFVVNIRMAPMGAALAPWLDRLRGWRVWGSLATLVDHTFAFSVAEMRRGGRDAGFLLGMGLLFWAFWVAFCAAGHVFAGLVSLPRDHPVFFGAVACFVSILVALWRSPGRDLPPWLLAAALAVLAARLGLPAPLPLLFGALAGAALGAWQDGRRERRA